MKINQTILIIKKVDISDQDNPPEDTSPQEDQIVENDESSSQKTGDINTEELKILFPIMMQG